jgi:hypothetical protein
LVVLHGCAKVVIFDIVAEVASAVFGVRDSDIDVYLCIEQGHSWGAGIAGLVKYVAAGAMGLFFLRADGADEVGVRDLVVFGDVRLFDEEDGPGAEELLMSWALLADAVGEEAAPFVREVAVPDGGVGAEEKLFERALLSGSR